MSTGFFFRSRATKRPSPSLTTAAVKLLSLLLFMLATMAVAQQFTFTTNNGAITITGYTGPGGELTIPDTINGLPVTAIGDHAFYADTSLTSVTIADSVTSIADYAFGACTNLTDSTMGNGVTSIGDHAFFSCISLRSIAIPKGVTSLRDYAFANCYGLISVIIPDSVSSIGNETFFDCFSLGVMSIPNSVTNIGVLAFYGCALTSVTVPENVTSIGSTTFGACHKLKSVRISSSVTGIGAGAFTLCTSMSGVYFAGNAPALLGPNVFGDDNKATVYYLSGATGWGATFGGLPTALWLPQAQTADPSFGIRTNQFGFTISWASDKVIIVEATANLTHPAWAPVATNILTGGASYFSDPQWRNYPARYYRLRSS